MAEHINREAVLRAVQGQRGPCRSPAQNRMLDYLKAAIARIPSDDVEQVIRCKDCYQSVVIGEVLHCTYWGKNTDENGYCHEGG